MSLMDELDKEMQQSESPSLMDELDKEMQQSESPSLMDELDKEMAGIPPTVDNPPKPISLSEKSKEALAKSETGLEPSGYFGDVVQWGINKFTGKEAEKPREVSELYTKETGKLAPNSLDALLQSKMSAEAKKQVLPEIMEQQFKVPREAIEQARLVGPDSDNPIARGIYYIDALSTGEFVGKWAALKANQVLTGRQVPVAKDFTTPEQDQQIAAGKPITVNGLTVNPPDEVKDLASAKEEMWNNYVAQVRDIYFQGTQQGVLSDVGMAAQLLFGIGEGRIAAGAAKMGVEAAMPAVKAGLAVANPISAVAAKVAPQAMSKFAPRLGVALTESAAMVPPREADPLNLEERAIGMAMGGGLHLGGEIVGKLSDSITGYREKNNLKGTLDHRTLVETLDAAKDPEVRATLDRAQQALTGTSVQQDMDVEALRRTAKEIKDNKEKADLLLSLSDSVEMKAAAGKPNEVLHLLERAGLEDVSNVYKKERASMSIDNHYRKALLENVSVVLGDSAHPIVAAITRMKDAGFTQDTAHEFLLKTVKNHNDISKSISERIIGIANNLDSTTISHIENSLRDSMDNFRKIDTNYIIPELKRIDVASNRAEPGYMQEQVNTGIEPLISHIEAYNKNIDRHLDSVRGVTTALIKSTFIDSGKDTAKKMNKPEHTLIKRTVEQPEIAFSEHLSPFMMNQKIDIADKQEVRDLVDRAISGIANNQRVNLDFEPVLARIRGKAGSVSVREVQQAIVHYNKEFDAMQDIAKIVSQPDVDVMSTIAAFRKAGEKIITPINLDKLAEYHGQMSAIWSDSLEESSLDFRTSHELLTYLMGNMETRVKATLSAETSISSETHAANLLANSKIIGGKLLDLLDKHYAEAFKKPFNRNQFMAEIYNPKNISDIAKFDAFLLDIAEIKKYREGVDVKLSNEKKWYAAARNTEMTDFQMTAETNLVCFGEIENIATATRISKEQTKTILEEGDLLNRIVTRAKAEWGTPEFSEATHTLNGRKGILDVGDFFFVIKENGSFELTETGSIFSQIFLHDKVREDFAHAILSGNTQVARGMVERLIPEEVVKGNAVSKPEFSKFFVDYFNRNDTLNLQAKDWEIAISAIKEFEAKKAAHFKKMNELIADQNHKYRDSGIRQEEHRWKQSRSRNKRKTDQDINEMHEIFKKEDVSTYFRTDLKGQLDIANRLDVGEIMHPAEALVQDLLSSNVAAMMFHPRAILAEHGLALTQLGHSTYAHELLTAATVDGKQMTDMRNFMDRVTNSIKKTPMLKELAPWYNMFYRLFATPANASMSSLGSLTNVTISQQLQNMAYSKGHGRTVHKQAWETVRGFELKYFPRADQMSLDMMKIVKEEMRGYVDDTFRVQINIFRELMLDIENNTRPNANRTFAQNREYALEKTAEWIQKNAKERVESSLSKNTLTYGGVLYENTIRMINKEGRQAAFEMLKPFFKNKTETHIWGAVTAINRAMQDGDPYRFGSNFLKLYHTNNIGRFGLYSSPPLVRGLMGWAPQVVRFYSSRTNNLYRLAQGAMAFGEVSSKVMSNALSIMKNKPGYETIPNGTGKQIILGTLLGIGTSVGASYYKTGFQGFPGADEVSESARPYVPEYILNKLFYGMAQDFGNNAVFSTGDWEWMTKLAKGDIYEGMGGLVDSLLLSSRTRGATNLFIGAETVTAWKELADLNEKTYGWLNPFNGYTHAKSLADGVLQKAKEAYAESPDEVTFGAVQKAEEDIQNLYQGTGTDVLTGMVDSLLGAHPVSGWLLHAYNPTTISSMLLDSQSRDYLNKASSDLELDKTKPYAGIYMNVLKQLDISTSYDDDAVIAAWYGNFVKDGVLPEDVAKTLINITVGLHNATRTADTWLNWLRYEKMLPGKKEAIEKTKILDRYKASGEYRNPIKEEEVPVYKKDYNENLYNRFQRKAPK